MRWKLLMLFTASFSLWMYNLPLSLEMHTTPHFRSGPPAAITLFLSGDVMTGRGIDQALPHAVDPRIYEPYVKDARDYVKFAEKSNGSIAQPLPYDYIWGDALQVWKQESPDLKIINLETSITNKGEPWPGKGIQYRMHPANTPVLKAAGIDFASLANNHVMDWGRTGLQQTLTALREANIPYAGAGQDLKGARKPAIFSTPKGRVIIFAYGSQSSGIPDGWAASASESGVNLLPDLSPETVRMIADEVNTVRKPGDVVVFSVHWGSNWGWDIPAEQRSFAKQLIDSAGIDLVHGHSSHHPRGVEVYKDRLILYGAGDFINDYEGIGGYEHFRGELAIMYFPRLDPSTGRLISMKMVPMEIRNFQLNHATRSDAKWLRNVLDREGKKLGTSIRLQEDGSLTLHWQ